MWSSIQHTSIEFAESRGGDSARTKDFSEYSYGNITNFVLHKLALQGDMNTITSYYTTMGSTADDMLIKVSEKEQRSMVIFKTEPEQVFNSMKTESWFADVVDEALNKTTSITFPQLTDLLVNDVDFGGTLASFLIPKIQQDHFYLAEHHLYGSSRLGIKNYWPAHYEFSYKYGVNTNTWENEVSNNQLLSLHKPWYSQKLNALINSNQTEPYGNANTNAVVSNRIIGLKNYELTNHLGNVMAVISDKLVDSTTTNLVTDLLPLPSHRKTSLQAVYDYYPFGMLMPNRYAEDHTVQCLPISKNIYYTSWERIHIARLEDPTTLNDFDLNPTGGGIDIQIEPGEQTLSVLSPSNQGQVVNLSQLITTGVEANKEVNLHVSINNRSADVATISLQQLNTTTNQWEAFASTTVAREATIELKGTPLYNSAIKINFSANDMDMTISDLFTTRHDLLAGTELALICNGDNDFDKDYRFGFNGQMKDNEIAGIGNHNTALFWEYDTRLGRRWNIDPVDQVSVSNYAAFDNNPIINTDVLGDDPKDKKGNNEVAQPTKENHNNPRWNEPKANQEEPAIMTSPTSMSQAPFIALRNMLNKSMAKWNGEKTYKRLERHVIPLDNPFSKSEEYLEIYNEVDAPVSGSNLNQRLNDLDILGVSGIGTTGNLLAKTVGTNTAVFRMIIHHIASNKHLSHYTPLFTDILKSYPVLKLTQAWNLIPVSSLYHYGRHPNLYHNFVLDGMSKAHQRAKGNAELFLKYFKEYVTDPLIKNPDILHK